ncbi:hypothetical protein COO60DRAFT_1483310 [Scenedesmus sp. NREL 46B-D3]|nr:hypothetical protein COO60DRAFT_1483310 [Scenedesmus sp. NREL 46B-D3]
MLLLLLLLLLLLNESSKRQHPNTMRWSQPLQCRDIMYGSAQVHPSHHTEAAASCQVVVCIARLPPRTTQTTAAVRGHSICSLVSSRLAYTMSHLMLRKTCYGHHNSPCLDRYGYFDWGRPISLAGLRFGVHMELGVARSEQCAASQNRLQRGRMSAGCKIGGAGIAGSLRTSVPVCSRAAPCMSLGDWQCMCICSADIVHVCKRVCGFCRWKAGVDSFGHLNQTLFVCSCCATSCGCAGPPHCGVVAMKSCACVLRP